MRIAYWQSLLLFALLCPLAATSAEPTDALAPKSSAADALVSPLKRITVSTNSLAESLLFYRDGMGMSVEGPLALSRAQRARRAKLWNLASNESWQLYRLYRVATKGVAEIELVVFARRKPAIHGSWSALELGPFSMGFPNTDQIAQDKRMRRLGFGALNVLESYPVPRPDGTRYQIDETIFNGPDFVHAVGIHRGDGMAQLGATDAAGLGGPAYSAQVVTDSQAMIDFMTNVLGWELRSDRQWKSAGTKGALNVPDGTEFRFSILYAKGATSGHVLLVQYLNVDTLPTQAPARVPNRGIGMWTMHSKDLNRVRANADTHGSDWSSVETLDGDAAVLLTAPNGFQILVEGR